MTRDDDLTVALAGEADRSAWDTFLTSRVSGSGSGSVSGYHEWAWRTVFRRSFGHDCFYLIARRAAGELEGILPLVEVKGLLFGRMLTSLPFVNYGGMVASSEAVAHELIDSAIELARQRGCDHIELRHTRRQFADLPCKQHKVAMQLRLEPNMWDRIDRKVRNQIRKAQKSGLTAEIGGAEALSDFYAVFARNMRDLGTPVYARRFFEEVLRAFPDRARALIVRLEGKAVAAAVSYRTGATMEVPWASSIRDYNALCPNHILYWKVIESALADGCEILDFGRSTPDEGTYKFKEQWGAAPVPLHWEYCLLRNGHLPDHSPKNPKFRLAIEAWKRCPLWLANTAGPLIVRWIP